MKRRWPGGASPSLAAARCLVMILILASVLSAGCGGNPPNVGGTCTATGGCDEGLTCNVSIAGGYCTAACTTPGVRAECPDGSWCDVIAGSTTACTRVCNVQQDCRSDLECNGTSGSGVKTCKPKT